MLSNYSAVQPLGSGATGIVFLATKSKVDHTENSASPEQKLTALNIEGYDYHVGDDDDTEFPALVAVKAFRRSRDEDLQRCKNEENVLSKIKPHPFLPRLYSVQEDGDFRFVLLTYCAGGDLNHLRHSLPDNRFSPSAIKFYAAEIVLAIEHLHSHGIVYRDLKPENILLSSTGHVTLSDFDLSVMLPAKIKHVDSDTHFRYCSLSPTSPHYIFREEDDDDEDYLLSIQGSNRAASCLTRHYACFAGGINPDKPKQRSTKPPGISSVIKAAAAKPVSRGVQVMPASKDIIAGCRTSQQDHLDQRCKSSSADSSPSSSEARSHSFVGTEEYVAPEVIMGTGHSFPVDWWSLGIMLYEMAYAKPPFRGADSKDTFRKVLRSEPVFPASADPLTGMSSLQDLICRLLAKNPEHRLGSCCDGSELKAHPFFAGLQWDSLHSVARTPFLPPPSSHDHIFATSDNQSRDTHFDLSSYLLQVDLNRTEARAAKKLHAAKRHNQTKS